MPAIKVIIPRRKGQTARLRDSMSKGFAARRTFERLDLDSSREPRSSRSQANGHPNEWVVRDEVIRIVARIRAQLSATDRVLMFAGVTPGEGPCELAWESALALSRLEGERVLLVDTGVSAPWLHKRFNLPVSPGLAEALAGDCFKDAVQTVVEGRLHVMPAGQAAGGPAALFSSPGLAPMMQVLRADYRFVLLNAPPMLTDVSASLLSPFADGVVLTVASGSQRRADVRAACNELRSLKAKMLGVVLCETGKANQEGAEKA